ncbi:MAG: Tex-like N-terminal domain-containing protein [Flavobacteriales bacterium]
MTELAQQLASELAVRPAQIEAAIRLMDDGASVPFIARYRKEATDGLDDSQLRKLEARLTYLRDLNERRGRIIESIRSQDRLTPDLLSRLNAA